MAKPIINYKVVAQTDRTTGQKIYRPVIVERDQTLSIETVAKMAYQNGLTNVKSELSVPVVNALSEMISLAAQQGHAVKMGDYFQIRPYLTGSCGPDGKLTDKNGIRMRIRKGTKFAIPFDTYKYQNVDSDLVPKVDFCISSVAGAKRNMPVLNNVLNIQGSRLEGNNMVTTVEFWQVNEGGEIIGDRADYMFDTFTTHGENLLAFNLGTTILPRKYIMKVARTHTSGVRTESLGLAVEVVANA